jgi:GMP synthase (glutamine-hydrolysing)
MKPVLVLQHLPDDGPAFLATWLKQQGHAMDLRHTAAGQAFPEGIDGHGALAVLGGEWSANDDRPSLRQAEALIRQAVAAGVPVLGHCLGGQLMSRAMGGTVGRAPVAERGWHAVAVQSTANASAWFGEAREAWVFQWHRDAFTLPPGAERVAGNAACENQAFALGPHLAMQFHIEVDAAKLAAWADEAEAEEAAADTHPPSWHGAGRLRADTARHLAASQALAARIYARWLRFAG